MAIFTQVNDLSISLLLPFQFVFFSFHYPGNGFKNVHFHVVANLRSYYTEYITKVRETVAAIVGCTVEEIIVNGYLYSNSFILVLSIKEIYLNKLLNLKRQDKDELGILYIDYFKVDGKPIYLERSEGESYFNIIYLLSP